ncbi:PQQ-binding-like beta-propeller repeat protein [Pontibacter ruber]|uniref:PQQ-binding-like beta-propeller repeat protein n=1 Tax=Pontibacter ruber TaxID=1343895 RepID=A0ABW5D0W6_9BACT|nr:PQQ-binding-like beta-propeller repeat protein [Pontibacter ruber]
MNTKLLYSLGLLLCFFSITAPAQQPTEEWVRRYDSKGSQNESFVDIAVDEAGNSYITGTSNRTESGLASTGSIVTVKYSPSGEELWAKVFRQDQSTGATAIAVDNTGGVYVTGRSGYYGNEYDYITIRYEAATGEESWVKYYNGTPNGYDMVSDIVVDNNGGVYVTGASSNYSFGIIITDYATIRYDAATGKESWVQRYNGPDSGSDYPAAIAVDSTGGLYVTGFSGKKDGNGLDYATISYDAYTGSQRWVTHYDSGSNIYDEARAIAVDNQGGVYVTGYSFGSNNTSNFATIRYDSETGEQTWLVLYTGEENSNNIAEAISVDNEGGVYVAGTSSRAGNSFVSDFATIRYDAATGKLSWEQRYNGEGSGTYIARAIAVDNKGGVFVTGSSGYYGSDSDYVTIRYNTPDGNESWVQRYNGPANGLDQVRAVAVGNTGRVVVTGYSEGSGTGPDFATISYDAKTGTQSWASRYDVIGDLADYTIAVVADAEGNSYVTGTSSYEFDMIQNRSSIVTIKYSPSGDTLWVQEYKGEQSNRATAIAIDNQGGLYVTGYSDRGQMQYDYVTIRYDAVSGQESWVQSYNGKGNGRDISRDITVDDQGGVYVTGYSYSYTNSNETEFGDYATIRYEASTGEQTWVSRYEEGSATAIAIDDKGGVYVTGSSATIRYEAATGQETWVQPNNTGENKRSFFQDISVDKSGGVYTTGSFSDWTANIDNYLTVRYDAATGKVVWSQQYAGPVGGNEGASAITVDNKGGVFVTGSSAGDNFATDYTTIRYEAFTGQESWVQRYSRVGKGVSYDRASAIAVDSLDGVYVTGTSWLVNNDNGLSTSDRVFSTIKYNAATGTQLWDIQTAGPNESAVDMALDRAGNIIVTGYSLNDITDYDFLTVKYSQKQCPALADAAIQGKATALVNIKGSTYTLADSGATTFTWRITDGSGSDYTSFSGQGSNTIKVNWPSTPDVYKLSLTYGGEAGCPVKDTTLYVHVFDPQAGFVTGGGWITSPVNSAYEFMKTNGKAYFGLMARYKKGEENRLQGETQLLLESGSFYFRSISQLSRTLVISGNQAFYRGRGKVSYRDDKGKLVTDPRKFMFLISATDGQLDKAKEADKLRLLVWEIQQDGTRGAVVYDNQIGCSTNLDENAEACQTIGGGNIVIHQSGVKRVSSQSTLVAETTPDQTGLVAYPTAFSDRTILSFASEEDAEYTLELYDLKGALVKRIAAGSAQSGQRYEHELKAEGLGKGMYLVRLTSGSTLQTVKLVVQK